MDFIDSFFEVEWIEIEIEGHGGRKEVIYKEDFGSFNEAVSFYLKKKEEENTYIVRLLNVLMESKKEKDRR